MHSRHVLLQRFADAGLEFVVVGGFAGVLHGSTYLETDAGVVDVLSSVLGMGNYQELLRHAPS